MSNSKNVTPAWKARFFLWAGIVLMAALVVCAAHWILVASDSSSMSEGAVVQPALVKNATQSLAIQGASGASVETNDTQLRPLPELRQQPSAPTVVTALPSAHVNASRTPDNAKKQKQIAIDAALTRLQALQASGSRDPALVSDALGQLQKANGSPMLNGVDLQALRDNLALAQRMQQLAGEIQILNTKPDSASPEVQSQIKQKTAKLQVLVQQMQTSTSISKGGSSSANSMLARDGGGDASGSEVAHSSESATNQVGPGGPHSDTADVSR